MGGCFILQSQKCYTEYMRWFLFVIIGAFVVAVGLAQYVNLHQPSVQPPVTVATTTDESTPDLGSVVNFMDPDYNFSLMRPELASIVSDVSDGYLPYTHSPVAGFELSSDLFQGTNLSQAGVYIGVTASSTMLDGCTKPSTEVLEKATGTATFKGVTWNVFTSNDAAAGNLYDSKTYRTVHNGQCYEITELLHSGNIGNFPPGTVVQFDHDKFSNILESIAQTFSFTK